MDPQFSIYGLFLLPDFIYILGTVIVVMHVDYYFDTSGSDRMTFEFGLIKCLIWNSILLACHGYHCLLILKMQISFYLTQKALILNLISQINQKRWEIVDQIRMLM